MWPRASSLPIEVSLIEAGYVLAHPPSFTSVPIEPLPRLPVEAAAERLASHSGPFVVTGAMDEAQWGMLRWHDLEPLRSRWPSASADLFPNNMLSKSNRRGEWLVQLPRGLSILASGLGPNDTDIEVEPEALSGRYLHLQLTPAMWANLQDDGLIPSGAGLVHQLLDANEWLRSCLSAPQAAEYHVKLHWKMVIAGTRGAGMYNHTDYLGAGSWHAHLFGSKWWRLCGPETAGWRCVEGVVRAGEVLFYGGAWSHHTQCVEDTTVTISDTVVHEGNFERLADRLHLECSSNERDLGFSSGLCDALDTCYAHMHHRFRGVSAPAGRWRTWREEAGRQRLADDADGVTVLEERERIDAAERDAWQLGATEWWWKR